MDLKKIDVEKIAAAVEADAGQALAGLRESLLQAKNGHFARLVTPEQIAERKRGRPVGSTRSPVTLRVDTDALKSWRATGKGWQTRAAQVLAQHAPA